MEQSKVRLATTRTPSRRLGNSTILNTHSDRRDSPPIHLLAIRTPDGSVLQRVPSPMPYCTAGPGQVEDHLPLG